MKKLFTYNSLSLIVRFATLSTLVIVFAAANAFGQCSIVGTGTVTGNVNYGSSNNWANPNRSTISDDIYARVQLQAGETSKYLEVSDYGWVLPPAATILGIEVQIEGHQEDLIADMADASIRLMKAGVPTGTDHAGPGVYDDKDLVNTYGNSVDLWGTTWTAADIMDPGFGVLYSVTRLSGPSSYYMFVDYVEVTVYYTDGGCILPVTYKAYDVTLEANKATKINWITASEVGADHFSIERSPDGVHFAPIAHVQAQGSSDGEQAYSYTDQTTPIGTSYYRLQQVDRNGQAAFTEVRDVTRTADHQLAVSAFPNPATDYLQIEGNLAGATVQLYDIAGHLVVQQSPSTDTDRLDVSYLQAGVYLLNVTRSGAKTSQRVMIQ
jgi:Secretion system C-terminal sorting domain